MSGEQSACLLRKQPTALPFRLEMEVGLEHLSDARQAIDTLVRCTLRSDTLAARLSLAAHELLENALKYSLQPMRPVTIEVWIDARCSVGVAVFNASREELYLRLAEQIRQLNGAPDPVANYLQVILASMQRTTGSGLGLARIRSEAEMTLCCDFNSGVLCVRAETTIGDDQ